MKKIVLPIFLICFLFSLAADESEEKFKLTKPYALDKKKDVTLLLGGVLISGTSIGLSLYNNSTMQKVDQPQVLDRRNVNRFDRISTHYWSEKSSIATDVMLGTLLAVPSLFMLDKRIRDSWLEVGILYIEALLINYGTTFLVKELVGRNRPYLYNDDPAIPAALRKDSNRKKSFFSGHTSFSFMSAVFLSTVFSQFYPDSQWKYLVWTSSLLVAGTVGMLRVRAGKHYPTDVITGAVAGSLIGMLIPMVHKNKDMILTFSGPDPSFVSLTYRF